jgi:hypothetical protein
MRQSSWRVHVLADFSRHVEKSSRDLTPFPPSLLGKGENSKPLSRVGERFGERFSTSREKLDALYQFPKIALHIDPPSPAY